MSNKKPLVLISMLNWGFGHITRCFPLILTLLELKKTLLIVCTPLQKELLEKSFTGLSYHLVPDNTPKYGKTRTSTLFKLSLQAPLQLIKIKNEQKLVKRLLQFHDIELIVSDNKYGFFHPSVPSVILTHQLNVQTGWGKSVDKFANVINHRLLEKFTAVWVVDGEGKNSLAGKLSASGRSIDERYKWIGPLNRLQIHPQKGSQKILIILSGPEPQRTVLEEKIVSQLPEQHQHITLIRGTDKKLSPKSASIIQKLNFKNYINLAGLNEIERQLSETELVIGRAGYTSMMEWITGGWKAIVVPTPGQAEQEYLAKYLMENKRVYAVEQNGFNLTDALREAQLFAYDKTPVNAVTIEELKAYLIEVMSKKL